MRKRHPNHRLVKIHRSYSVEEIAKLFGIHKNTVRSWVKVGLTTIDDKRPMLILGHDLAAFLQARRLKNKRTCKPGELYCVRCRVPKFPAGDMADYEPVTEKIGNLIAICPDCHSIINRRVSLAKIEEVCGKMDITFPKAMRHIVESTKPTVNSDLG
jgi:hypothetical protein